MTDTAPAMPPDANEAARRSGHRLIALGAALCGALPVAGAVLAGTPLLAPALAGALFAALALGSLRMAPPPGRMIAAIALVGQLGALTGSLAGHPWQVDSHMLFFAALAVTLILNDRGATLAAAGAIVLHHLVLTLAMPTLLYPSVALIDNLQRLAVHGAAVVLETLALLYAIGVREQLDEQAREDAERLVAAMDEAKATRAEAEAALTRAESARAEAEAASALAEAATRDATEEKERSERADREARDAEAREAARRKAEIQSQQQVVESLRKGLKSLSENELSFRLNDPFPTEYEELRADFNAALDSLEHAMSSVLLGANSIGRETSEITNAADNLARRTEGQAATLAEVAASVSSLTEAVGETAGNAARATEDVSRTRNDTQQSVGLVTRAVEAMSEIETSSQQIQSIIKVIDDIAFQTNLLALNAGVEAARAGEAGRGFAVVASEVRALAQRSSEAAGEIKGLIEASGTHVGEGVDLVRKTGEALQTVKESVASITQRIAEIAQSAESQSTSLGEIDVALSELDQVTQRNAAMFEETSAASQSLAQDTEALVRTIAAFIPEAQGRAAGETSRNAAA